MAPPAAAGALKTKSKEFYDIIRLIGAYTRKSFAKFQTPLF
jgi:hypothetical protein